MHPFNPYKNYIMKKAFLFIAITAFSAILFSACKKDDVPATTAQKLQQKWNFEKTIDHGVQTGFPEYRDTLIGVAGEYVDFRTDNLVYSFVDGTYDTVSYSIISDSKLIVDGDTTDIQVLDNTQCRLYSKTYSSATDYFEFTVFLKK